MLIDKVSNKTTIQLQERLKKIDLETIQRRKDFREHQERSELESTKIRQEITSRTNKELAILRQQLAELNLQARCATDNELVAEATIIEETISQNKPILPISTPSKVVLANGALTNLFDCHNAKIRAGDKVRLGTVSTKTSPFRSDKVAIVIGTSHYGRQVWLARLTDRSTATDREPGNVAVFTVKNGRANSTSRDHSN